MHTNKPAQKLRNAFIQPEKILDIHSWFVTWLMKHGTSDSFLSGSLWLNTWLTLKPGFQGFLPLPQQLYSDIFERFVKFNLLCDFKKNSLENLSSCPVCQKSCEEFHILISVAGLFAERFSMFWHFFGLWNLTRFSLHFLCLFCPDMIPENALEEITKKLDPNLVIAETKEDVQLK